VHLGAVLALHSSHTKFPFFSLRNCFPLSDFFFLISKNIRKKIPKKKYSLTKIEQVNLADTAQ